MVFFTVFFSLVQVVSFAPEEYHVARIILLSKGRHMCSPEQTCFIWKGSGFEELTAMTFNDNFKKGIHFVFALLSENIVLLLMSMLLTILEIFWFTFHQTFSHILHTLTPPPHTICYAFCMPIPYKL